MAPPDFPQGMTLDTIGYAALKFPNLPPGFEIPLDNQVGLLQRSPPSEMNHMVAQLASQYLNALIEFQSGDDPLLKDRTNSQYYFSMALNLLNFLTMNPDVCIRVAKHPTIVNDVIEKMLAPDFETTMKACDRSVARQFQGATFDSDFGSVLQFLSTLLLYPDQQTLHPRIRELIPKLRAWKRDYKSSPIKTISNASDRLIPQIEGMPLDKLTQMREIQATSLVCGQRGCRERTSLTACSTCKIQRYCGREHQKADWKYHKHICNKGLVVPSATT